MCCRQHCTCLSSGHVSSLVLEQALPSCINGVRRRTDVEDIADLVVCYATLPGPCSLRTHSLALSVDTRRPKGRVLSCSVFQVCSVMHARTTPLCCDNLRLWTVICHAHGDHTASHNHSNNNIGSLPGPKHHPKPSAGPGPSQGCGY